MKRPNRNLYDNDQDYAFDLQIYCWRLEVALEKALRQNCRLIIKNVNLSEESYRLEKALDKAIEIINKTNAKLTEKELARNFKNWKEWLLKDE